MKQTKTHVVAAVMLALLTVIPSAFAQFPPPPSSQPRNKTEQLQIEPNRRLPFLAELITIAWLNERQRRRVPVPPPVENDWTDRGPDKELSGKELLEKLK